MPEHDLQHVRQHYAQLAPHYDQRANKVCKYFYTYLLQKHLSTAARVLEIGAGATPLLNHLNAPHRTACDLSREMLTTHSPDPDIHRLIADAQHLPIDTATYDAVYCINVLEHVPNPAQLAAEALRILRPGGYFLAITPNGAHTRLLHLLEQLHLKLPEGPHQFLTPHQLNTLLPQDASTLIHHRPILPLPAGPRFFAHALHQCLPQTGLFLLALFQKNTD